jgi:hypothetical protein
MRAESGVHIPEHDDSGPSRPEQTTEQVVASPVRAEEQAGATNPDAGNPEPGSDEPPAGEKPAARGRRPKKK